MRTHTHGSAAIPESEHQLAPTSEDELDRALAILKDHAETWVHLPIHVRTQLLDQMIETTLAQGDHWVAAGCAAKGIKRHTPLEGEEWLAGPALVVRNLRLLSQSLRDITTHGVPVLPKQATARPDGQVVAEVFPTDQYDALMFPGFTGEVWMDPDLRLSELPKTQAEFYKRRTEDREAKVALVLGAGNVSSIGPMDALYKLFVEGQVVILKMNPVNEYLGPIFEKAFAPLVQRGFFRVVLGGAKEGAYLCGHPLVDEIHITGSDKTHDAIVFGVGEEGAINKQNDEAQNAKRVTSELGNVSPIIVVPGPWSQSDLEYQGINIVSSLTNNAGFNCNATRVVVQHRGWNQRNALIKAIRDGFAQATPRVPYYPGAKDRQQAFVDAHPDAYQFGGTQSEVPWTFVTGLAESDREDICVTTEAFCGVTSELQIEASDVVSYIQRAVEYCNNTIWGTLSCSIIVHPESMQDPKVRQAVEQAIADLRYGSVAVNHWAALAYGFVSTTWGAFPGHQRNDIRSGVGVVHNTYLFDKPQKTVVRGPFRVSPKPAWFFNNKTTHEIGRKLTAFYGEPSIAKVPGLLWSALRG